LHDDQFCRQTDIPPFCRKQIDQYFFQKNIMHNRMIQLAVVVGGIAVANIASAHPGHGTGLLAGMAHPLFGLDHALAMLAVGFWAWQLGGRAKLVVPGSFVFLMALGGWLGLAGIAMPFIEAGIAASVLLVGLLTAFAVRLPTGTAAAIAGAFAVFHGYAHGVEMPALQEQWTYVAGFMAATAALHGTGMATAMAFRRHQMALRMAGASIATTGAWLLTGAAL
jgi:urease accessory protein